VERLPPGQGRDVFRESRPPSHLRSEGDVRARSRSGPRPVPASNGRRRPFRTST
jgi:hypothetical protein